MTPLDRIEAAEKAAHAPNHGEETYELKQAWDRYNEADSLLDKLLRNHAADLIAVARAAQALSHFLENEKETFEPPSDLLAQGFCALETNDDYDREEQLGDSLLASLAPLTTEGSDE